MSEGLPIVFLYAAYKLQVTFEDLGTADKIYHGTCFFVYVDNFPYLVTNRHVIDPSYKEPKYKNLKMKDLLIEGYFTDELWHQVRVNNCTFFTPEKWDEDLVVAILLGNQTMSPSPPAEKNLWPRVNGFDQTTIASQSWLDSNLKVCDAVAFPGYPPFHDWNGIRPIMRMGSIASDPTSDYCWESGQSPARRVAYEAMSFNGSSGSPIIVTQTELDPNRPGQVHRTFKIVGVNAGHVKVDQDQSKQHSGISYFFKSSAVDDLLNKAVAQRAVAEAEFIAEQEVSAVTADGRR
jgi:hypothetical protein